MAEHSKPSLPAELLHALFKEDDEAKAIALVRVAFAADPGLTRFYLINHFNAADASGDASHRGRAYLLLFDVDPDEGRRMCEEWP